MKDRIIQLMNAEGLTAAKFAEEIGIQRAAMSHITIGRNNPSLDVISKILGRFPAVDPDWLLFGKGNMRRNDISTSTHSASKLPDLFAKEPTSIHIDEPKAPEYRKETASPHPANMIQHTVKEASITKDTPVRKIARIMIFYSNHTYETFVPEK